MRNYIIMDGVDSRDFGVYINGDGTFGAPAREVSTLQIPGRNGDAIVKADRLQNYDLTYSAFIYRNLDINIGALRAFLLSHTSYFRLEDTYHPNEYRMAFYRGPFTPTVTQRLNAAKFNLTFNVKPQRYLKSGDEPQELTSGTVTVTNPTRFNARPIFRIYGNGGIIINNDYSHNISIINNESNWLDLDCDLMEAYKDTTSRNMSISHTSYNSILDSCVLKPGENSISILNLDRVILTPRWWTL